MDEYIITGSLVFPGESSPTRVVLRNKLLIVDESIYDSLPTQINSSGSLVSYEKLEQDIINGIGFNPFPFPLTPVFSTSENPVSSNYTGNLFSIAYLGEYSEKENLTIEFNGKSYSPASASSTDTQVGYVPSSGGAYSSGVSYNLVTPLNANFGQSKFYVGPESIEFNRAQDRPPYILNRIAYSYIIGTPKNLENGKIVDTNFKSLLISLTRVSAINAVWQVLTYANNYTEFLNYEPKPEPGPEPETTDPYAPGGTSKPGGGSGSFDVSSNPVDFSQLPTLSAVNAGFISLFNPTNSELQALASKLWSTDFLDVLTRFFSDPADVIIALSIVPIIPPVSARVEVQAGFIPTGVSMNKISTQYIAQSCGSVQVLPFYDAALDYSPFTKLSVFLPFIGVRNLDVDECMGKTLAINYNVDLLSGSCVCEIKCGDAVLYSFNGNVVSEIPISSRSFDSLVTASMGAVTAIGTAVATGGATTAAAVSATANAIMSAKPEIIRSGNTSSMTGLLAGKIPYLIYQIPNQSVPESANTFTGYPSNITATLGDLTGFTQVSEIHIEGVPATDGELDELDRLLKGGVIL